jgi:glycosyltransferase involved in cell wall biosynthesis
VRADMPLISVVLCTYNGERFLAEQLDSILAQTHSNLEIIAADDGSSDDTVAILQRSASTDARIRILVSDENTGFDLNFERAFRHSTGDFIAPCDQDDVWLPEKLATLQAIIDGRSMAYCDSALIDEGGHALGYSMSEIVPMRSIDDPVPFAFGNCVSGHAMLFRRQMLERALPIAPHFFYDWWFAALAASLDGIEFCDRQLVLYRQHGANVTSERFAQLLRDAGLGQGEGGGATTAFPAMPQARKRGHRLRYLRETEQRLAALARLPSRHQSFLAELHRLWAAREAQWISPRLWRRISQNRDRLLALTPMSERDRSRYCADFFWGLRIKRLTRRTAYQNE